MIEKNFLEYNPVLKEKQIRNTQTENTQDLIMEFNQFFLYLWVQIDYFAFLFYKLQLVFKYYCTNYKVTLKRPIHLSVNYEHTNKNNPKKGQETIIFFLDKAVHKGIHW